MAYKSFYYSLLVILQSIAESLPFSSSTHIYLFKKFFAQKFSKFNPKQIDFYLEDFAHGCTAVGLIPFFIQIGPDLNLSVLTLKWILIVDSITSLGYFFLKPKIEHLKPTYGLFFTAVILSLLNFSSANRSAGIFDSNFFLVAIFVGFLQLLAFMPGVSRLAIVYVFLKFVGLSNHYAWYFAWVGMWPLLVLRSFKGFYQLILQNISVKFLGLLFLLGSFLAYVSLTFMYDYMLNWQFIFLYPLIMGIICLTTFPD
jgi:undecaprenyl pyrophosphate phosphatase UppP